MIGKTIVTFDTLRPVEDTAHLLNVINECRKRPDPADAVDFSEELQTLETLQAMLGDIAAGIGCTAQLVTTGAQMEADELGTRFIVSGGEVTELGPQMEADEQPDPTKSPCEFGSAAWFAGIPEIPFEGKE